MAKLSLIRDHLAQDEQGTQKKKHVRRSAECPHDDNNDKNTPSNLQN